MKVCPSNKLSHQTRKKAWNYSLYLFTQHGFYGTPYKCKLCKRFHLTSKYAQFNPSRDFIQGFNDWYGEQILEKRSN